MQDLDSEMNEITLFARVIPISWAFLSGLVIGVVSLVGLIPAIVVAIVLMLLAGGFYWIFVLETSPTGDFGNLTLVHRIEALSLVAVPWVGGCGMMWLWSSHTFWGMLLGSLGGAIAAQAALWKADFTWITKRPELISFPFDPKKKDLWQRYYSQEWNFAMLYPSEWEILHENRRKGSSVDAVIVGRKSRRGTTWFCLMVSPSHEEVIEGDITNTVRYPDHLEGGFGVASKKLSGNLYYSDTVMRSVLPLNEVVDVQEMSTHFFALGLEFTIMCRAHVEDFDKLKPFFAGILNSFNIGTEPSPLTGQFPHYSTIVKAFGKACAL